MGRLERHKSRYHGVIGKIIIATVACSVECVTVVYNVHTQIFENDRKQKKGV